MKFEGVNFNDAVIVGMEREEFISTHLPVFWQDRDEKTREKMLGKVYDLIIKHQKPKKDK